MRKWLAGLVGLAAQDEKVVSDDLKRLNAVKTGLGDQASAYVRTGEHEAVLSTLSVHCQANPLEICKHYVQDNSPTTARRRLLARGHPYPLDLAQRYADVLAAAGGSALESAPGTRAVPQRARMFFGEAFLGLPAKTNVWPRKAAPLHGKGLILDTALQMVRRLDADVTDFFDVLYAGGTNYAGNGGRMYREVVELAPLAKAQPGAVIAAASRMPATARAELIHDLIEWGLSQSTAFAEFLVTQAGDASKAAREAAVSALASVNAETLEPLAVGLLQKGGVEQRAGMVELLARLRTPSALDALRAHRETERVARIVASIDTVLTVVEHADTPKTDEDDARVYTAIDGRRIEVPPLKPLADDAAAIFGSADREVLRAAIAEANERARKQNEENARRGYKYKVPMQSESMADRAVTMLNARPRDYRTKATEEKQFLSWGPGVNWARSALTRLPDARAIAWAANLCGGSQNVLGRYAHGPGADRVRDFLHGPNGDVRHFEAMDIDAGAEFQYGNWQDRKTRRMEKGDFLRNAVQDSYAYGLAQFDQFPKDAAWPYLAENLGVFDEALGVKPQGPVKLDRAAAIGLLALLPATPARYFAPLLEAATGPTKAGRAEARAMLSDRPEVEQRLIALLDDSRQVVRAGAAEWLAERKDASAAKALWARLKKEKSELARAAFLTALKRLGEDLSTTLGPDALIAEAQKGLKSAKFDKLEWLALDALPRLRFRSGAMVPADVIRWWIVLAFKLKQPGGNALFGIYLDQLEPQDAVTFSTWLLDAWLNYDSERPSEADANAHAKANAPARYQMYMRWNTDYTEEKAFADIRREFLSQYIRSAVDFKGVLGLAVGAPPAIGAERVRAYLKNHGSRTSQASALLEMLAANGDPVALQVVIAASTRLKQKSVQKFAGELISKVAEERDWTLDELSDRTIPSAGFDDDGVLTLACGEDGKEYEARLKEDLSIVLRNPDGKEVSSLPAGQDEATTASKKQLATTKKELKQIAAMQSARLYEALCAERKWASAEWLRQFHGHPVMRRLIEGVVWLGLDESGAIAGSFRPTAEGDFTDNADARVDVATFAFVRIAHGALLDDVSANAWEQHLKDYEVKPLFAQFGRTLLKLAASNATKTEIEDRKGWLTDTFTVRGVATKLGYERGPALDGGFFNEYRKSFQSAGVTAVIEFSGNSLPEENVPAAIISLSFEKEQGPGRFAGAAKLSDVPPVLLFECWNDYHAIAAKGVYDAEWEKRTPW